MFTMKKLKQEIIHQAGAKYYNRNGKLAGTGMDTPNTIAATFKAHPELESVHTFLGEIKNRSEYAERMKHTESKPSFFHA